MVLLSPIPESWGLIPITQNFTVASFSPPGVVHNQPCCRIHLPVHTQWPFILRDRFGSGPTGQSRRDQLDLPGTKEAIVYLHGQ